MGATAPWRTLARSSTRPSSATTAASASWISVRSSFTFASSTTRSRRRRSSRSKRDAVTRWIRSLLPALTLLRARSLPGRAVLYYSRARVARRTRNLLPGHPLGWSLSGRALLQGTRDVVRRFFFVLHEVQNVAVGGLPPLRCHAETVAPARTGRVCLERGQGAAGGSRVSAH